MNLSKPNNQKILIFFIVLFSFFLINNFRKKNLITNEYFQDLKEKKDPNNTRPIYRESLVKEVLLEKLHSKVPLSNDDVPFLRKNNEIRS